MALAVLLVGASAGPMLQAREARFAARQPDFTPLAGADPLLVRGLGTGTQFRDSWIRGMFVRPAGPGAPVPPGFRDCPPAARRCFPRPWPSRWPRRRVSCCGRGSRSGSSGSSASPACGLAGHRPSSAAALTLTVLTTAATLPALRGATRLAALRTEIAARPVHSIWKYATVTSIRYG
ncbi:MAG TPA: hypothetical protein VGX25_07645 [Actinophytocola sp.]|uniref:hypothetical protein n=1 Tax=Actinophytocola sp. TaxID=1872138 RepID=UPI002DDCD306|nr:hypothetical protein [Actinophytocola sp.]HEV2779260.1 hypothetical protein [Actinophytocola sp.]